MLQPSKVATSVGGSTDHETQKYIQLHSLREGTEARESKSGRTLAQLHDLILSLLVYCSRDDKISWRAAGVMVCMIRSSKIVSSTHPSHGMRVPDIHLYTLQLGSPSCTASLAQPGYSPSACK